MTLPRQSRDNPKKIYIVDVYEELIAKIPKKVKKNAEVRTQQMMCRINNPKECARELYSEYIEKAKLVITTKLHCAAPCIAAGIPVIMLSKKRSCRFSFIDRFVPIYTMYSQLIGILQKLNMRKLREKCSLFLLRE